VPRAADGGGAVASGWRETVHMEVEMAEYMTITVDAMGGDNAPEAVVEGCLLALGRGAGYRLQLIGDEAAIRRILTEHGYKGDRIEILNATQVIGGDEVPTKAIREKKDSSIVRGLSLLKEKRTDAFFSCGNTGALLTGAMLIAGRIEGVDRPALAPMIPTGRGFAMLIDAGLNTSCKPVNYEQFAEIGSIYMKTMYKIASPKVGLLNVGTEENKGTEIVKEAYGRLAALRDINFIGNIEGRDLTDGKCDVAVCDGFVGNVVLKCYESIGSYIKFGITDVFRRNTRSRLAAALVKKDIRAFFKQFDYEEYGGTPILGVGGSVFKGHGNASAKTVMCAIDCAVAFAKTSVLDQIRDRFAVNALAGEL
jgi:glycerol-3-phosphate acyltransferase PlsX